MTRIEYCYTVASVSSSEQFNRACDRIMGVFPEARVGALRRDEDGSSVRPFSVDGKRVLVVDDKLSGAVYLVAEFRLPAAVTG